MLSLTVVLLLCRAIACRQVHSVVCLVVHLRREDDQCCSQDCQGSAGGQLASIVPKCCPAGWLWKVLHRFCRCPLFSAGKRSCDVKYHQHTGRRQLTATVTMIATDDVLISETGYRPTRGESCARVVKRVTYIWRIIVAIWSCLHGRHAMQASDETSC